MEQFLKALAEKITLRRAAFEAQGITGGDLTDMTARWFNALMDEYYEKLMDIMTEDDFQAYKRAIDREDSEGFNAVLAKYEGDIRRLQSEILDAAV